MAAGSSGVSGALPAEQFPFWSVQKAFLGKDPSVLLFRHPSEERADGLEFPEPGMPFEQMIVLGLTAEGKKEARAFGAELAKAIPGVAIPFAYSSPVVQGQEALLLTMEGMGRASVPRHAKDELIAKGIIDEDLLVQIYSSPGYKLFNDVAKGMFALKPYTALQVGDVLLRTVLKPLEDAVVAVEKAGKGTKTMLGLACTHDGVLANLLIRIFQVTEVTGENFELWPKPCESMVMTRLAKGRYNVHWRGQTKLFLFDL